MLTEDASFAMPPLRTWYGGSEALRGFLAGGPLSGDWRWRHVLVARQRAAGARVLLLERRGRRPTSPFALNVLTLAATGSAT